MPLMKHPHMDCVIDVADDRVDPHLASGWLYFLDEEKGSRYDELELEADLEVGDPDEADDN